MSGPIEIMAAHISEPPNIGEALARAMIFSLDEAGWVIAPKAPSPQMIAASLKTPGMAAVETIVLLQVARGYPLPANEDGRSPLEQGYAAMVEAGRVKP